MVANGLKKAVVIRKALEEEINTDMPAGIIRTHLKGLVMIDEDAASLLKQKNNLLFADARKSADPK